MADRFSERIGITKPRDALQLDCMDDALRNCLWNTLLSVLDLRRHDLGGLVFLPSFCQAVAHETLRQPIDQHGLADDPRSWLRDTYFALQ
jgi:hypothetical protein